MSIRGAMQTAGDSERMRSSSFYGQLRSLSVHPKVGPHSRGLRFISIPLSPFEPPSSPSSNLYPLPSIASSPREPLPRARLRGLPLQDNLRSFSWSAPRSTAAQYRTNDVATEKISFSFSLSMSLCLSLLGDRAARYNTLV